jgi:hypothetical protein
MHWLGAYHAALVDAEPLCDKLTAENAKLRAENYALRDQGLRTYDGLAQKADMADELQRKLEIAHSTLEAVRSQMCWERDRDQLTVGMTDLHDSVANALKEIGE